MWGSVYCLLWIISMVFAGDTVSSKGKHNKAIKAFEESTKQSLLWAPYRSQCYFGIRPRDIDDTPFIFGLMWSDTSKLDALSKLRHQVDMNDHLDKFSWQVYDPRIGGRETVIDSENNLNLTISFAKSHDGKNWIARVNGKAIDPKKKTANSVIIYMNQNNGGETSGISYLKSVDGKEHSNDLKFFGNSRQVGEYEISIIDNHGEYYRNESLPSMEVVKGLDCSKTNHLSMNIPDNEVWRAHDVFQTLIGDSVQDLYKRLGQEIDIGYTPSLLSIRNLHDFPNGNFHYVQKTFETFGNKGFEFDIIYNDAQDRKENIKNANEGTKLISNAIDEITAIFNKHFIINEKDAEVKRSFALEILSNLLGGIGYFQGNQIVDRVTEFNEDQFDEIKLIHGQEEGPYKLFTSVPSRAFFPRGFYWDEGFHILQIMEYDFDLAFEIMKSWIDMIDDDGWIAREIILGPEARSRVPEEFRVQSPHIANPPTLLLAFSEMLTKVMESAGDLENKEQLTEDIGINTDQLRYSSDLIINYGTKLYPKLLKHYNWFTESQRGQIDEYEEILEDEPIWKQIHSNAVFRWVGRTVRHCLPSGLDDYPRAQPPDVAELNVDTLSWVGIMTRSMKQIASILDLKEDEERFAKFEKEIIENLDTIHWSEENNCYCDVTISDEGDMEELSHVCHEGYISLLPFALKLIPTDSPRLEKVVELMGDKDKLFSDYGLLSLSKQDEYFGQDENYWRGPIWLNINYLCLDALKHYYPEITTAAKPLGHSSKSSKAAKSLYTNLRRNLIDNIFKNWEETGYVFENYSPVDGHGTGAKQFTGWTSLVVNIMGF